MKTRRLPPDASLMQLLFGKQVRLPNKIDSFKTKRSPRPGRILSVRVIA